MSAIIYERHGHLAHIRLNRADHGNRFTMEMFRTFGQILTDMDAEADLRCTLVTANGAHFSVGVDPADVLPAWAAGKSPFDDTQVTPTGVTGPKTQKTPGHGRQRQLLQRRAGTGAGVRYLRRSG
jgi:enoyl-CoA hydratase